MIIRSGQMEVLSDDAHRKFERQLVEELRRFAPWHAEILGADGLLKCVRYAEKHAEPYGFTNRGPIRLYLQSMFLLGSDFDTDPTLPWAAQVLNDSSIHDQTTRSGRLYEALNAYTAAVAGPNNEYAKEALRRASDELAEFPEEVGDGLDGLVFQKLQHVYPRRCEYAGEAAVSKLIAEAKAAAVLRGLVTARASLLFSGLMLALGHGFQTDPHLPWIQKTLGDPSLTEARLIERLLARVGLYLQHVMAHVS